MVHIDMVENMFLQVFSLMEAKNFVGNQKHFLKKPVCSNNLTHLQNEIEKNLNTMVSYTARNTNAERLRQMFFFSIDHSSI